MLRPNADSESALAYDVGDQRVHLMMTNESPEGVASRCRRGPQGLPPVVRPEPRPGRRTAAGGPQLSPGRRRTGVIKPNMARNLAEKRLCCFELSRFFPVQVSSH